MRIDLSNTLAAEMDKVLNSEENKQMFSSSSMLEKLAFKKVSEEEQVTEVEMELDPSLRKTADCHHCECKSDKKDGCKCDCHEASDSSKSARNLVLDSFDSLLKISEDLDTAGFDKLAAASILLADRLFSEAKAKSSKKSDKKSDKKSKEDKASGKKMDMKERMKKMREMQKGKGKKKDDDKKSSKKDSKKKSELEVNLSKQGQVPAPSGDQLPQRLEPQHAPKHEADVIMNALPKGTRVEVELNTVKVHPANLVPTVTQLVQKLQEGNKLPFNKKYRVVPA